MANKQTLIELAQSNKSFQQWTREFINTNNLSRIHQLLFAGDEFRKLLITAGTILNDTI